MKQPNNLAANENHHQLRYPLGYFGGMSSGLHLPQGLTGRRVPFRGSFQ